MTDKAVNNKLAKEIIVFRQQRHYRGLIIEPVSPFNSSGIRWSACTGMGLVCKSDTLVGIKRVISEIINRHKNTII